MLKQTAECCKQASESKTVRAWVFAAVVAAAIAALVGGLAAAYFKQQSFGARTSCAVNANMTELLTVRQRLGMEVSSPASSWAPPNASVLYKGKMIPAWENGKWVARGYPGGDCPICDFVLGFCNDTYWLPPAGVLSAEWTRSRGVSWPPRAPDPGPDLAAVFWCGLVGVDVTFYTMDVTCTVGRYGRYAPEAERDSSLRGLPDDHVLVIVWPNGLAQNYSNGDVPADVQLKIFLQSSRYGAAQYPATGLSFSIGVSVGLVAQNDTSKSLLPVPWHLTLVYDLSPMWEVQPTSRGCEFISNTTLRVFGTLALPSMSASMLYASACFMWVLTYLTVLVACGSLLSLARVGACARGLARSLRWQMGYAQPQVAGQAPPALPPAHTEDRIMQHGDILAFAGALLFALPTMRGLWPTAPPSGTIFDMLTIYPQLMLVSFAIIVLLIKKYCVVRQLGE